MSVLNGKVDIISIENITVTDGIVMRSTKVLCNVWSHDIYSMTLATE